MQTNSKNTVIITAAVLVVAFFMPWISVIIGISAWDIVFGVIGKELNNPVRFIAVFIPVSGILLVHGAAFNNEKYVLPKTLLLLLPAISLIIVMSYLFSKINDVSGLTASDVSNILQVMGIGFWLTAAGCIVLAVKGFSGRPSVPAEPPVTTAPGEDE
jgi:hypothetical protein